MSTRGSGPATPTVSGEIWWLHPVWTSVLLALIVSGAAYALPDTVYRYFWRTPKYFGEWPLLLCAVFVAIHAAGCYVGGLRTRPADPVDRQEWTGQLPWDLIRTAFLWCFWLALAGYAVWGAAAVSRGANMGVVVGILSGDKGATELMKDVYLVTISGVTTLTQLGVAAVVLGALLGVAQGWRRVRWPMLTLFGLAVLRALLNSERLAVIELAIPLLVLLVRLVALESPRLMGTFGGAVRMAPVVGAVALVGLFAVSEYFRSWLNFYSGGDIGFWTFVTMRLLGYYVTALNNGALLVEQLEPTGLPYFTMQFLWRFPVTGGILKDVYPTMPHLSESSSPVESVLTVGANFEFNNPDGYLVPMLDFGVVGALVYWLIAGLACGFLYRSFCRKQVLGLLVYPLVFTGIVEMPRILYWGSGRVVPAFAVLGVVAYCCIKWRQTNEVSMRGS